jgi:hypothetical protein
MSSAQDTKAARESVVQRCYDVTPEACASAVALLLQSPVDKNKAVGRLPSPGGRDSAKEIKNGCAAELDYS